MGVNERMKERDIGISNLAAAIPEDAVVHGSSVTEIDSERKPCFQLTLRHIGAAAVSGLPAASSS